MSSVRKQFERGFLEAAPEVLAEWRGRDALADDVASVLDREFERCDDPEFARRFAEACPVDGCTPEDYLQQVVALDDGRRVMAGIRMHGGEGFPFVDLVASTRPIRMAAALEEAALAAFDAYRNFDPEAVRMLCDTARPLPLPDGWFDRVDQFLHAGPVGEVAGRNGIGVPPDESLELTRVDDLAEAAPFVGRCYASFFEDHPTLESRIAPATEEELEECAASGLLRYARVNGERAGLFATQRELGSLVRGQCVLEEVLDTDHRGHGLAPGLQMRAAAHFQRPSRTPCRVQLLYGSSPHSSSSTTTTSTSLHLVS